MNTCSQILGPIAVSFQEKLENVSFSKLIFCNSYIICCLIRILFRYQYFDSCCGRLRDEHLLGVAFFKCLFTITITIEVEIVKLSHTWRWFDLNGFGFNQRLIQYCQNFILSTDAEWPFGACSQLWHWGRTQGCCFSWFQYWILPTKLNKMLTLMKQKFCLLSTNSTARSNVETVLFIFVTCDFQHSHYITLS